MTVGVVLMAYGTPRTPEEIEPYYTDIRRGRPPTPEQLADLTRRYEAIGGISPLAVLTRQQGDGLQAALDARAPGGYVVALGLKHAAPKIEDGVAALAAAGVDRVVGLVLAPHYSAMSVGEYLGRARLAADGAGLPFAGVESWATEPAYVDFIGRAVVDALVGLPAGSRVVFTAHSLPERILAAGDPYPDELRATARRVAEQVGLDDWAIGWQSAGPDAGAVDRSRRARRRRRVRRHRPRSARVPVRLRRRPPRGAVRPRHRGPPARRRRRAPVRPDAVDERRSRRARRAGRARRGPGRMTRVLIVGGGIAGLATAHALAGLLPDAGIELWEADERLGGKIRTTPFAGLDAVDEGADAFLARVPHATSLAREVGLGDDLTSPTGASAAVWFHGLHPIPEGLLLGVPADMLRLSRSRLLSWRGKARAALEPLLPRRDDGDSIGTLVRSRFGDEVHERLVDALVGSIYATDTDDSSLAMVPQLAALAGRGRSLLLGARAMRAAAPAAVGPVFHAPGAGWARSSTRSPPPRRSAGSPSRPAAR